METETAPLRSIFFNPFSIATLSGFGVDISFTVTRFPSAVVNPTERALRSAVRSKLPYDVPIPE